jgi:hypothetical protein
MISAYHRHRGSTRAFRLGGVVATALGVVVLGIPMHSGEQKNKAQDGFHITFLSAQKTCCEGVGEWTKIIQKSRERALVFLILCRKIRKTSARSLDLLRGVSKVEKKGVFDPLVIPLATSILYSFSGYSGE